MSAAPDTTVARQRAHAEWEQFERARPSLARDENLRGRWVVFRDGAVQYVAAAFGDAYRWALQHFGPHSGFVIGEVLVEPRVHRVGGAQRARR